MRLPGKPFIRIEGKYIIVHLLDRLIPMGLPIYLAVPHCDVATYRKNLGSYIENRSIHLFAGDYSDPLKRMHDVAAKYDLDHIVRINHDKIFICYQQFDHFISHYFTHGRDYLYSTNFIPGMGFEIFSVGALKKAHATFKGVEHVSYAVEAVASNAYDMQSFPFNRTWLKRTKPKASGLRLLIDYKDDVKQIAMIMEALGKECEIAKIADMTHVQRNLLPEISVYTCSYDDVEFIERCARSVLGQCFHAIEYIMVDDGSVKHPVTKIMGKINSKDKRVRVFQNKENKGLASASNYAISMARGRYVVRLDADDYFVDEKCLSRMFRRMEESNADIIYPHNYMNGSIQKGCEKHHVGGAMFKKRALDYLQFTEGLRHFDGLDLYYRARLAKRKIEYFTEPTFYYRQRETSLSNAPSSERAAIEGKLNAGTVGKDLVSA